MRINIAKLIEAAITYDKGDARRIQHFMKVHDFAVTIGTLEHMDEETLYILESAAVLHDIGIHASEEKYGSNSGKYQEIEGPAIAEKILSEVGGYTTEQIERIKYLIGHHHTYNHIQGLDYQILVEADFLVNLYEDGSSRDTILQVRKNIFKTEAGLRLLERMFLSENVLENVKTVAVSACLIGINCKYNGNSNKNEALIEWLKDKKVVSVCPEVLGGLSIPRTPAEIVNGTVINKDGVCVHQAFVQGAEKALDILRKENIDLVILQSRSPSCGVKEIYDGSFSGKRIKGQGIFAKMAIDNGYQVMDIEDFEK